MADFLAKLGRDPYRRRYRNPPHGCANVNDLRAAIAAARHFAALAQNQAHRSPWNSVRLDLTAVTDALGRLPPPDRALLEPLLLPKSLIRRRRMAARDAKIRDARQRFFPGPVTVAARRLASALGAYAASRWRWERRVAVLSDAASERTRAMHAILLANGGAALGWRRIADIFCNKS